MKNNFWSFYILQYGRFCIEIQKKKNYGRGLRPPKSLVLFIKKKALNKVVKF